MCAARVRAPDAPASIELALAAREATGCSTDGRRSGRQPGQALERARELLGRRRAGRDTRFTDDGLVLIESFPAVPHLVIAGGGELAELLVAQAHLLG
ncbi:hypothetical protein [Streptomyces sp. NPDC058466]|uniref:hypothetical protein n=1 Tax=Streptomyces sp. NPDC058466 TaxID=3346512 RepID=UPI003646DC53